MRSSCCRWCLKPAEAAPRATNTTSSAAFILGDLLRPATRVRRPGAQSLTWEYGPLTNPAGINASWAVLYGAGYFTIAIVVLSTAVERGDTREWLVALVVTAIVLGVGLGLLYPVLAPLAALRSMERREVVRDGQRGGTRFVVADPVDAGAVGVVSRVACRTESVIRCTPTCRPCSSHHAGLMTR